MPFDDNLMESTLVDEKISNLLGVLKWDLRANTDTNSTFDELFSFGLSTCISHYRPYEGKHANEHE